MSTVWAGNVGDPALSTIEPEALSHFPEELRELQLTGYRIERLPEDFGEALPHLIILTIREAGLRRIPGSIGRLFYLVALRLDNNRLTGLPDTITALSNLRFVTLNGNPDIVAIPPGLLRLPNLREMHLRECGLRVVTPNIGGSSSTLTTLDLYGNNLQGERVAWDSLSHMASLRTLILGGNALWALPRAFAGPFASLKELDLADASLLTFPVAVLRIGTLAELVLSRNYIRRIPAEISQLTELRVLDISDMPTLTALPDTLRYLGRLQRVVITRYDTDQDAQFVDNNYSVLRFLRMTQLLVEL